MVAGLDLQLDAPLRSCRFSTEHLHLFFLVGVFAKPCAAPPRVPSSAELVINSSRCRGREALPRSGNWSRPCLLLLPKVLDLHKVVNLPCALFFDDPQYDVHERRVIENSLTQVVALEALLLG